MVTTFAGRIGTSGSTGGAPTDARFNRPADVSADPSGNLYVADLDNHLIRKIGDCPLFPFSLLFAHFGEGNDLLTSEIILLSLALQETANVRVVLRNNQGEPLSVDLNGQQVTGELEIEIPACGIRVLAADGLGEISEGSVTVLSDQPLAGVVLFGGVIGVAGVGASPEFADGFIAPMQSNTGSMTRSGVALMNLQARQLTVTLTLFDSDGRELGAEALELDARGHQARFVDELFGALDLSDFRGVLKVTAPGKITATVLQTQPGEFVTLPVVAAQDSPPAGASLDEKLQFSHFGRGAGLLSSEITLLNLDPDQEARAAVLIQDGEGNPIPVSLNGEPTNGQVEIVIPACGSRVLRTGSTGEVVSGSVVVCSDIPVGGVILFGGVVGFAGVGSSPPFPNGFVAPMQSIEAVGIRPGIAISNLESFEVNATLRLFDEEGTLLESVPVALAANGQTARFLDELFRNRDFADFLGLLKVTADGQVSATVLQTRPGQFATLPVAAIPVQ